MDTALTSRVLGANNGPYLPEYGKKVEDGMENSIDMDTGV